MVKKKVIEIFVKIGIAILTCISSYLGASAGTMGL